MKKRWVRFLLVGFVVPCLGVLSAHAGYRTVQTAGAAQTLGLPGEVGSAEVAPAEWTSVQVRTKAQSIQPANRAGRVDQINLQAEEEVTVTLTKPDLPAGARVFAYTVNGGRINGTNVVAQLTADKQGQVQLTYKAGRYFGNYCVVLRYGGREEVLNFWVAEARLDTRRDER